MKLIIILIIFFIFKNQCYSKENVLYVAVSSNFLNIFNIIKIDFEKDYNCNLIISSDSTGSLYTKIVNNAPYDIFISADKKHTKLLIKKKLTINKDKIYTTGKLIIWIPNLKKFSKKEIINNFNYELSIANKNLSPYGKKSEIIIKSLKIKTKLKLIQGMNINQTFNFIFSNNCKIGFISLSQAKYCKLNNKYIWKIPNYMYKKIKQKMVILKNGKNHELAKELYKYLTNKNAKIIMNNYGYKI